MTIPEILKELEPYTHKFPRKAMQAAIEQREAILPELLRVIEAVAENPQDYANRKDYQVHFFALYLLAQFREKRAYPAIVKMFSAPGEIPFELAGDTSTTSLSRILASVYDGNASCLKGMVENEQVNEFVRASAIDTFLVLENTGQMPRGEVVEYFKSLFQGRLQRTPSYTWSGLACAVADLPAPELLEEVRLACVDDLVDPGVVGFEEIKRDLVAAKPRRRQPSRLITDAIAELEWWFTFNEKNSWPASESPEIAPSLPSPSTSPEPTYVPPKPFVREDPKIGRNDPCPCGSEKKYKKSCGK